MQDIMCFTIMRSITSFSSLQLILSEPEYNSSHCQLCFKNMKNTFHVLQPILFFTYSTICIFVYCKKNSYLKKNKKIWFWSVLCSYLHFMHGVWQTNLSINCSKGYWSPWIFCTNFGGFRSASEHLNSCCIFNSLLPRLLLMWRWAEIEVSPLTVLLPDLLNTVKTLSWF